MKPNFKLLFGVAGALVICLFLLGRSDFSWYVDGICEGQTWAAFLNYFSTCLAF